MLCLRCGYCCQKLYVMIIDKPEKGIGEDNIIPHMGDGNCKHLKGSKPGEYKCNIHSHDLYKETPCYEHNQIEDHESNECRIGRYIIDLENDNK